MDVLVFLVFVFLLVTLIGGYLSLQHAIIKPVVDWISPEREPEPSLIVMHEYRTLRQKSRRTPADPLRDAGERALPDGMRAVHRLLTEQRQRDREA